MSTKQWIGKTALMGACLLVVALTSGCGFFCTDDSQCRSNICRVPLCSDQKAKIEDPAPTSELTEILVTLFTPPEPQP